MSGRRPFLNPPALLLALLTVLLSPGLALGHRLNAQAFLLPGKQVQIEGWFSTGDVAKGARVEVRDTTQRLVRSGQLNADGVFIFSCSEPGPLIVVVMAGAGHRAELSISSQQLTAAHADSPTAAAEAADQPTHRSAPITIGSHDPDPPIKDILIGAAFLLALAAFVLSLRNARKLKEMKSRT